MTQQIQTLAVVGAGQMGNGIAHAFAQSGHDVTLIDKRATVFSADPVDGAVHQVGDACELSLLEQLHLQDADVVVWSGPGWSRASMIHATSGSSTSAGASTWPCRHPA